VGKPFDLRAGKGEKGGCGGKARGGGGLRPRHSTDLKKRVEVGRRSAPHAGRLKAIGLVNQEKEGRVERGAPHPLIKKKGSKTTTEKKRREILY